MDSTNVGSYLEDEIDLRKYIFILFRHWWLIGLVTFTTALVALIVSFLLPPTFEATALVAITGIRYEFEFNPLVDEAPGGPIAVPPYQAMLTLATADELLGEVMMELKAYLPPKVVDLEGFRKMVEAKSSDDPSVLRLTASAETPDLASQIANAWASRFVTYVNDIYKVRSDDRAFFSNQQTGARDDLDAAEEALIDFQLTNQVAVLEEYLSARKNLLASYLDTQNSLTRIKFNLSAFRSMLEARPQGSLVTLGDDLASLGLQIRALNASGVPIQFDLVGSDSLSERTAGDLTNHLADLENMVEKELVEIEAAINPLPAEILELQKQKQEFIAEEDRLTVERDVAREAWLSISRKLDETQILAESAEGDARLASLAAPPIEPTSPRKLFNTALAGVLGLMLGVFGVFFKEYMFPQEEVEDEEK